MIYFIQAGEGGPIKIGWTEGTAENRLRELQTGNAHPLTLLGTADGGRDVERRLHERFAAFRCNGEWFRPAPALIAFIVTFAREGARPQLAPLAIYLAGKIGQDDWRSQITPASATQFCARRGDVGLAWEDCPRAIFGVHTFTGPFYSERGHDAATCDSCEYDLDDHSLCSHGPHGYSIWPHEIVRACLAAIDRSDVVFAWLDCLTAFGTFAEVGHAAARGKAIWVASPGYFPDLWFVYGLAHKTVCRAAAQPKDALLAFLGHASVQGPRGAVHFGDPRPAAGAPAEHADAAP